MHDVLEQQYCQWEAHGKWMRLWTDEEKDKETHFFFFKHQVLYACAALVATNVMSTSSHAFFSDRLSLYNLH